MADGASNIPEIVTTDLSSIPSLNVRPADISSPPSRPATPSSPPFHSTVPRAQGDSTLLSPHPRAQWRTSLDSRSHSPSPTVVSSNDGASFDPHSLTLFTQSSVHFTTFLSLRDNKPEERSDYSSLHLLPDKISTHHRKTSSATFTSSHEGDSSFDETEPHHAVPSMEW